MEREEAGNWTRDNIMLFFWATRPHLTPFKAIFLKLCRAQVSNIQNGSSPQNPTRLLYRDLAFCEIISTLNVSSVPDTTRQRIMDLMHEVAHNKSSRETFPFRIRKEKLSLKVEVRVRRNPWPSSSNISQATGLFSSWSTITPWMVCFTSPMGRNGWKSHQWPTTLQQRGSNEPWKKGAGKPFCGGEGGGGEV
jgi:hypothetical protein